MKRSKKVEEAIRLTWDSLESHLGWTHKRKGKKFHQKCVKDYARVIRLLSRLY